MIKRSSSVLKRTALLWWMLMPELTVPIELKLCLLLFWHNNLTYVSVFSIWLASGASYSEQLIQCRTLGFHRGADVLHLSVCRHQYLIGNGLVSENRETIQLHYHGLVAPMWCFMWHKRARSCSRYGPDKGEKPWIPQSVVTEAECLFRFYYQLLIWTGKQKCVVTKHLRVHRTSIAITKDQQKQCGLNFKRFLVDQSVLSY